MMPIDCCVFIFSTSKSIPVTMACAIDLADCGFSDITIVVPDENAAEYKKNFKTKYRVTVDSELDHRGNFSWRIYPRLNLF